MITHRLHIDEDDCDYLTKQIEVSFPLMPGIELMVDPAADWNHFLVDTATWHPDDRVMVCWLKFVGLPKGLSTAKSRELLVKHGWEDEQTWFP